MHTHVTAEGLIFINFDASDKPPPFDEYFPELLNEWERFSFSEYEYVLILPFIIRIDTYTSPVDTAIAGKL